MREELREKRLRSVVVTGVGLISPLGVGTEETWQAILKGRSGIAPITLFSADNYACRFAGEVKGFVPEDFVERRDVKKMGRFIQFAMAAAHYAMTQAAIQVTPENAERVGVYVGSGIGAFEVIEREHGKLMGQGPSRVSPFFITASIANLAAGQISIRYGARGPNLTCATACTTGAHAIGEAFRIIQRADADVMICGGSEAAVTPLSVAGFSAMRALSTRNDDPETASRPWDCDRGWICARRRGGRTYSGRARTRFAPRRQRARGACCLRREFGRLSHQCSAGGWSRSSAGHGTRVEGCWARALGDSIPECPRHINPTWRSGRGKSNLRCFWGPRRESAGQLNQVNDGSSAGSGRKS